MVAPVVINGWTILAHPLFLEQLHETISQVEKLREKDAKNYTKKNASKRLMAIRKLVFRDIPQDPSATIYRQGSTLGDEYKHWFRAKFFQQYRLFFRYHSASKIIVYAWVNDTDTIRAYGTKNDAYFVFKKMLNSGHPPDDWDALLKESKETTLSGMEI